MKKLILVIIMIAAVTLTGCFADNDDEAIETTEDSATALPEVTATPEELDSPVDDGDQAGPDDPSAPAGYPGYPAPQLPTRIPPAYPVPEAGPTVSSYPGGLAIIIRPTGLQCQDPIYIALDEAVGELEDAGIEVQEASQVELVVCDACGCPTSVHYRVLIDPLDLEATLALGWERAYK